MYWVARTYSRDPADLPAPGLAFNQAAIPRPASASVRLAKQAELKAQAERYAAQDSELAAERQKNENLDAELARSGLKSRRLRRPMRPGPTPTTTTRPRPAP
jgi:type I restriction enzyme R subunit